MIVDPLLQRAAAALRHEIFTGPLETVAFALGIANIVLLIRRSIWNYPVGIVLVSIYAYVFFQAHLYSDALLQIFFFFVNIIGWFAWLGHQAKDGELIVVRSSVKDLVFFALGTAAGALLLGLLMKRYTPASFPFWDATVAAASVTAQILLTVRRIENWAWWIAANLVSIVIYPMKGLYLSAALYLIFMLMSAFGYSEWLKRLRLQQQNATAGKIHA